MKKGRFVSLGAGGIVGTFASCLMLLVVYLGREVSGGGLFDGRGQAESHQLSSLHPTTYVESTKQTT